MERFTNGYKDKVIKLNTKEREMQKFENGQEVEAKFAGKWELVEYIAYDTEHEIHIVWRNGGESLGAVKGENIRPAKESVVEQINNRHRIIHLEEQLEDKDDEIRVLTEWVEEKNRCISEFEKLYKMEARKLKDVWEFVAEKDDEIEQLKEDVETHKRIASNERKSKDKFIARMGVSDGLKDALMLVKPSSIITYQNKTVLEESDIIVGMPIYKSKQVITIEV